MQTIILAGGALLVTFLVILVLSLGFTIKGKILIALTSFVLALGGIAALNVFALWQAGLMLLALVFISAYFMDNRFKGVLYQKSLSFGEEFEDELTVNAPENNVKKSIGIKEEFDLPETFLIPIEKDLNKEEPHPALVSVQEETLYTGSDVIEEDVSFLLERESDLEISDATEAFIPDTGYLSDIESLLETDTSAFNDPSGSMEEINNSVVDEDISFLMNREIELDVSQDTENLAPETSYLSDIESLLELDSDEKSSELDAHLIGEPKILSVDDEDVLPEVAEEHNPIDDSMFDFLNGVKEVASDLDDTLEEIKPKKTVKV